MKRKSLLQHFVQSSYRYLHAVLQSLKVKLSVIRKWVVYKGGQVDAAKKTASACRQRLLSTGIDSCVGEILCVAQEVPSLDAIPEQSTRLRIVPVCLRDLAEQLSGVDLLLDDLACSLSCIVKEIVLIFLYRLHEVLVDAHGNIGLCDLLQIGLQVNELLHIRVGTVDGDHQRSASSVLSDQSRHKGIQLHKGHGAACLLCRIVDACPSGA